jgi:hypothetical protein
MTTCVNVANLQVGDELVWGSPDNLTHWRLVKVPQQPAGPYCWKAQAVCIYSKSPYRVPSGEVEWVVFGGNTVEESGWTLLDDELTRFVKQVRAENKITMEDNP